MTTYDKCDEASNSGMKADQGCCLFDYQQATNIIIIIVDILIDICYYSDVALLT